MPRIGSPADLEKFRTKVLSKRDPDKPCITLCSGSACHATGSGKVAASIEEARVAGRNSRSVERNVKRERLMVDTNNPRR